jgi:putative SOS response-associated peptidase YedK
MRLVRSRLMCGRFTLTYRRAELLAAEIGVPIESLIDYRPRFNIAPTDSHWIVRTRYEDREILPAKWGLINFWMTDRKQAFKNINARAETVRKLPSCPTPAEKERTFTIITTTPNALLEPIHDRMPVVLEEDAIDDWLYARQSPDSLMELLRPAREDLLVATPVSARVNSVKNDDPECLDAPELGDTTEE